MANTIEYIYEVLDRFSSPLRKFNNATEKSERAIERARAAMRRYGETVKNAGRGMRNFGAGLIAAVSAPLALAVGSSLKAAASVETMTVAFESMLGSAEKAGVMVKDLLRFAAKTPFEFEGIGAATKQLLAIGVAQGDVISKLQFLGDIAAGANVPLNDMASIFAKSKAKGKAMTEELLQLSDRGIPIIDVLAKRLNISKNRIFDLASKGRISFDILEGALKSMAEEGGIFHRQMIKQSRTLSGLWSTFIDALFIGRAELGKTIVEMSGLRDIASRVIDYIDNITEKFKTFAETNPRIAKMAFLFGGLLLVLGPVIAALGFVVMGVGAFMSAVAAISLPIVVAITGFMAFAGAMIYFYNSGHPIIELFKEMWRSLKKIGQPIADLTEKLELGGDASISFADAMKVLGDAAFIALTPLKLILQTLSMIVQTASALAGGDFSAAGDALARGFFAMGGTISDAFKVGTGVMMGPSQRASGYTAPTGTVGLAEQLAAFKAQNSRLDMNGNIVVSATGNSKVSDAQINLNGGSNVATAQ